METSTVYKKVGRRYIPIHTINIDGVQEGLWLVIKNSYSKQFRELLHLIKTHELVDVGKFSDFYKAHHEEIQKHLGVNYEKFIGKLREENKGFSTSDLVDVVIKTLSEIK